MVLYCTCAKYFLILLSKVFYAATTSFAHVHLHICSSHIWFLLNNLSKSFRIDTTGQGP